MTELSPAPKRLDEHANIPSPSQRAYFSWGGEEYSIDHDLLSLEAEHRLNPDNPIHQIIIGRLSKDSEHNTQCFGALVAQCEKQEFSLSDEDEQQFKRWKKGERPVPVMDPEKRNALLKATPDVDVLGTILPRLEKEIYKAIKHKHPKTDIGVAVHAHGKNGRLWLFSHALVDAVCHDALSDEFIGHRIVLQRLYDDQKHGTDTLGKLLSDVMNNRYKPSPGDKAVSKHYHQTRYPGMPFEYADKGPGLYQQTKFVKRGGTHTTVKRAAACVAGAVAGGAAMGSLTYMGENTPESLIVGGGLGSYVGLGVGGVLFEKYREDFRDVSDRNLRSSCQDIIRNCANYLNERSRFDPTLETPPPQWALR